ncbi:MULTISPECIES: type III secretion system export apparatus subunit SctR [Paraburkholderia]|uniref:Type III secretion protein R n=1 Tax=Paraburkholderia megapolitana TaxID=420953 RepID=A0A1I3DUN9_9BURK|nr:MULTISPECIES: type III secretion system export apparatus subunit SctR [Paraburkholderia]MCX4161416.1 type III secretion system export apparatus subunit SctR [Paraburkholderia megapolitana]MDN7156912.1 type III secretion system export apparatus subunit SctR [Paraburkholderia sp. CHISQ3]MDQ6493957.1 type III secretion system export apparatus subunit SctR [Paraburkholderia megapolitana]QDQ79774.1 EscR/YscR/HrcR family type III secretion system export apparatus protein [Paraburkholderia megapoli
MVQFNDLTGLLIAVVVISLIPFVAMVATSYAKIVVVLGLLRNALGVQQVPPNMVLNGIAILVTAYIMAPIGMQAMQNMQNMPHRQGDSSALMLDAFDAGKEPFRAFLKAHAHEREKRFFVRSAAAIWPKDMAAKLHDDDLIVLAPAFTLTEMTDAFKIGFLLYIAFVVVDIVIANVLMAMGLNQVQPTNVAIPFKLLLFVVMNGWSTLIHGLVLTYR